MAPPCTDSPLKPVSMPSHQAGFAFLEKDNDRTRTTLDDEAMLVLAGVADEDLWRAHSPASNSARLNFSTLQFSFTAR